MIDNQAVVFCPIHNCGCDDLSCDGALPVHAHEDCREYEDGETRLRLVCFKGDMPYELPDPYTQEELDRMCRRYAVSLSKRTNVDPRESLSPQETKSKKKTKRGRTGSGLKGKRTERMASQLGDFITWLRDNPINERRQGRTVGERAHQFWLSRQKTFERDATRTGEKKGYGSIKALAAAYRNSKH